ncbi:CheR family methyltransferase [Mesorhizobium caraganae]|uniref:CheR family methyltransferase n=1 Tax=Mesorhizobium caraganae TaxID=483206 RepID=UPI00333CEE0A
MKKLPRFPIVGIGASAGGIAAMEGFFRGMPSAGGMAFVVVTHLSPERESLLHEVIARYTGIPVRVAEDGMDIHPNTVYVMPHNAILTIENSSLKLRQPNSVSRERKPIDIFFSALAEDQGEYSVGVVLSGGDSDGTLGVKAIKEHGGLTLAQLSDESGPINPDMPRSAIGSGLIDIAISADEMGAKLIEFAHSFELLDELEADDGKAGALKLRKAQEEIYAILRCHSGHDFSGYKAKTFLRRVRRRMQITQNTAIEPYLDLLRSNAEEVRLLFRDLLINVTNFFRDTDAFKTLEETVIPKLFEGRGANDTIRVWVPGCATGEEVFSIGMLMREHMDTLSAVPRIQIFATDIDDAALGVARSARYPESLLAGVSPERRERFFSNDGTSFVLTKGIRDLCIFSAHSVIRDPPFSRMDMVSCRNLLIYFGPDVQKQVIPTFHYSLKPGGYLFLGTSESISQHADLFAPVDKKQRIFKAREHTAPARLPILLNAAPASNFSSANDTHARRGLSYSLRQTVEAQVLERFAPAHVVVNSDGDVVYYSVRTGKYLEPPQGVPSRQLLTMARSGLRLELRGALREAAEGRRTVVREAIAIEEDEDRVQFVTLTIEPLADRSSGEPLFLVLFEPMGPSQPRAEALKRREPTASGIADFERDLRDMRERLQSTIEEYETALEELKSSNEELVSVNEEAQSSNEELEASKEEMQSLNEELNTINAELVSKIEDLDRANSDLKNLFESTQIATVFLDTKLVIRSFTPAASSFFNLLPTDIGRPLTDLASRLDYPHLRDHIAQVFKAGEMIEHQLPRDSDGVHYLVRLIPYRNSVRKIQGVVVTFVDVTTMAEAEAHQRVLISELNHRVKNMLAVTVSIASQTLKNAPSPEAFAEALIGRLRAMARAYGVLSRESWKEASVEEIVRQEVEPFGLERINTTGEDIRLKPQQGLSLGMVIHELATNAGKYGALSMPGGMVSVTWSESDQGFQLDWSESGGPAVSPPEKTGFGLSLVKGEIEYRLGGNFETSFGSDGLSLRIGFPFDHRESET